jgi:hypothetical protein
MIALAVITFSGLHCNFKLLLIQIMFILQFEHLLDLFNVQFRINDIVTTWVTEGTMLSNQVSPIT